MAKNQRIDHTRTLLRLRRFRFTRSGQEVQHGLQRVGELWDWTRVKEMRSDTESQIIVNNWDINGENISGISQWLRSLVDYRYLERIENEILVIRSWSTLWWAHIISLNIKIRIEAWSVVYRTFSCKIQDRTAIR